MKKVRTKSTGKAAADDCGCGHEHGADGAHHGADVEVAVRPFRPEDYKELKAIWKAGEIVADETDSLKALKESLAKRRNGFQVFVAEARAVDSRSGKPLGFGRIAGGVILTFDGHRAYIYHFAVHPDFRGVGLGRALLDCCEEQARSWGARHLRLMSRTDAARAGARRLYEKSGWKRDETLCQYKKELLKD